MPFLALASHGEWLVHPLWTDSTMCLCLASCHCYSNSLWHATFSHCLNPCSRCLWSNKANHKDKAIKILQEMASNLQGVLGAQIKMSLYIAVFKMAGPRPPSRLRNAPCNRRSIRTSVVKWCQDLWWLNGNPIIHKLIWQNTIFGSATGSHTVLEWEIQQHTTTTSTWVLQ